MTERDGGGNAGRRVERLRTARTRWPAGRGRRAGRISRRRIRHRRRRDPGAGVLRMLPPCRRAARGADAAVHRHLAGDHHPDLDQFVSRPSFSRRGGHGGAAGLGGAGGLRRHPRQRDRALRAGAAVQISCSSRWRGRPRHGCCSAAIRGGSATRCRAVPDEGLWRLRRAALDPDGRRRRTVFESADDVLRPADPSGGRDLLGAWRC